MSEAGEFRVEEEVSPRGWEGPHGGCREGSSEGVWERGGRARTEGRSGGHEAVRRTGAWTPGTGGPGDGF